jgi:hypothetical protein
MDVGNNRENLFVDPRELGRPLELEAKRNEKGASGFRQRDLLPNP